MYEFAIKYMGATRIQRWTFPFGDELFLLRFPPAPILFAIAAVVLVILGWRQIECQGIVRAPDHVDVEVYPLKSESGQRDNRWDGDSDIPADGSTQGS